MNMPSHPAPLGPVAGLVLASGRSTRFGLGNKLLMPLDGIPLVRRTIAAYLQAALCPVIVVVGHEADCVREAIADLPIELVHNPDFDKGQSQSLVRGIRSLPAHSAAVVVGVADQPFLTEAIVRRLMDRYHRTGATLVVPRYDGSRGNPVLFDRRYFAELETVQGDQGGRPVVARHHDAISWVDIADARPGIDIDTEDDYRRSTSWSDRSDATSTE